MTEVLAAPQEVVDVVPAVDKSQATSDYLGSLDVSDILDVPDDAVEGLSFDTAHVFGVSHEERQMLEVRFGGEPLYGERFLHLLEAIAPEAFIYRNISDRAEAILDDWVIYEGNDSDFERIVGFEELAIAHSGLKGWAQLGREYPDIKAALEPAENFRLLPWMMPGNENIVAPDRHIPDWGWADHLAEYKPLISGSDFLQLLNDVYGDEEARTRVITAMRHIYPDKAREEEVDIESATDDELFQTFLNLGVEHRNRLISVHDIQGEYYDGRNHGWSRNDQTEKFTELYLERHCVTFETEDGVLMFAHGIKPGFDIAEAYAERRKVYLDSSRPRVHGRDRGMAYEYQLMDVDTIIGEQTVIIPGSVKFQELGLVPAVRWSTGDNGRRRMQPLPEHVPISSPRENVLSNSAGYMALAYLQPHRRKHWKTHATLPGIDTTQEMGPAQVPLIALQQSSRLLDNDLMREAESLATSGV